MKKRKKSKKPLPQERHYGDQRWTRGVSIYDGKLVPAWFNVTNWH
jgi:hypothetical protein